MRIENKCDAFLSFAAQDERVFHNDDNYALKSFVADIWNNLLTRQALRSKENQTKKNQNGEEGRKNLRELFEENPAEENLFPYRSLCPIPISFLAHRVLIGGRASLDICLAVGTRH
jgi:hypothetical protein